MRFDRPVLQTLRSQVGLTVIIEFIEVYRKIKIEGGIYDYIA